MEGRNDVSSLKENLKNWPRCMDWKKAEQFGEKQIMKTISLNRTKCNRPNDLIKPKKQC